MNLDRSCLNILPAWALWMKATYTLNREMSYWNATSNHTETSLIRNSNITNDLGYKFSNPIVGGGRLNGMFYILISISGFTVTIVILMAILWTRKYHTLIHTIRDLQGVEGLSGRALPSNPPSRSPLTLRKCLGHETRSHPTRELVSVTLGQESQDTNLTTPLERQTTKSASWSLWRPWQTVSCFNTSGLGLQHIIKAGREGVYYKAKVTRGTCKGHFIVTCKIIKEGATHRRVAREVSIMRKLGIHKNVLQLLDWNITQAPYMLILESVSSGTLRSFLQANQDQLSRDSQLQHFFTTAAYHIAHAMRHLCSKMVVHCDLALRNIMVNHFPREVKLAEFGLAQDLTHKRSHRSSCKVDHMQSVPLRWYPPEYFRNNYYSFKWDVWAFGIVLWEMQTFGTLPYPNLEAPELVVRYVCSGQRNSVPETCRPEILQTIRDCWLEPNTQRPSFNDIVRDLENILEDDEDYIKVDNGVPMANIEFGDQGQI
ncbi:fibroblast growth factor receptor homolog 1-like isoform X1 [Oncorhynchus nerka]|uniref:fibroblast growth factor receptor homolog 1-like isoform X1 n=2 Tax=Oncorhynchus nerka TaxID=8023 RepID=UPI00113232C4|nr:fibroblast growth factor receptor homolog 1-like isoform X1 [Oncorhynchus nerka]XP_029527869.1 fibroblast growth factor receptor homolog 1-like isoform X1 [Oncorhynchus nerka]